MTQRASEQARGELNVATGSRSRSSAEVASRRMKFELRLRLKRSRLVYIPLSQWRHNRITGDAPDDLIRPQPVRADTDLVIEASEGSGNTLRRPSSPIISTETPCLGPSPARARTDNRRKRTENPGARNHASPAGSLRVQFPPAHRVDPRGAAGILRVL